VRPLVVDASVSVKWFLPQHDDEQDTGRAMALLDALYGRKVRLFQPPHWLAETAAVITRISPETAVEDVIDLINLKVEIMEAPSIYLTACELSRELNHHLFDTLYHSVALNVRDAVLVTADERYFHKACDYGAIIRLQDITPI